MSGKKTVKVTVGMRSSYYAKIASEPEDAHPTYGEKTDMGAAVKGYVSITTATAEINGDDMLLAHIERFVSAQADVETTKSDLELNALCYGHAYSEEGGEESSVDDDAPVGAYAFIEPLLGKDKKLTYRATFLRKVQAVASSEKTEADTRKNDFNPKMNSISFFVMPDNTGSWRARKEFDTEAEAEKFLEGLFGSAE